jgi:hypothetical protein
MKVASRNRVVLSRSGSALPHSCRHGELHHYTTLASLRGIVASNTLWATSYRFLNDSTEVIRIKNAMISIIAKRMTSSCPEYLLQVSSSEDHMPEADRLKAAAHAVAKFFVDRFHDFLFAREGHLRLEPFVASFCSHRADSPYDAEHGLLSQWRAYGRDDGVCVVFDYDSLVAVVRQESKRRSYHQIALVDVVYDANEPTVEEAIDHVFNVFLEKALGFIARSKHSFDEMDELIATFVEGACRVKHAAFREEREVRLFAVPFNASELRWVPPWVRLAPIPRINTRGDRQVRYLKINEDGPDIRKALKRIIVGPSKEQARLEAEVRALVPAALPIRCSQIPFV